MIESDGLMGTAEIAALLGVSRQRVLQLAAHEGFPVPIAVLSMGKVWRADDIRAWVRARTGKRPSAPPPPS
jgi:predicted DNA-binding transcriptional regulator AlpA